MVQHMTKGDMSDVPAYVKSILQEWHTIRAKSAQTLPHSIGCAPKPRSPGSRVSENPRTGNHARPLIQLSHGQTNVSERNRNRDAMRCNALLDNAKCAVTQATRLRAHRPRRTGCRDGRRSGGWLHQFVCGVDHFGGNSGEVRVQQQITRTARLFPPHKGVGPTGYQERPSYRCHRGQVSGRSFVR